MRYSCSRIAAVVAGVISIASPAGAAGHCKGSKIYTHCTDNMAFLRGQCSAYPEESRAPCMIRADQSVEYTCQRYRVPCGYEGGLFDTLNLLQYPRAGAPSAPRRGFAPLGDQSFVFGSKSKPEF